MTTYTKTGDIKTTQKTHADTLAYCKTFGDKERVFNFRQIMKPISVCNEIH